MEYLSFFKNETFYLGSSSATAFVCQNIVITLAIGA